MRRYELDQEPCAAIAAANVDDLRRMASQQRTVQEIGVLRYQDEALLPGEPPDALIIIAREAEILDMLGAREAATEPWNEPLRQVLVQKQPHAMTSLRSRSAANERHA